MSETQIDTILRKVKEELQFALKQHGDLNSTHEGYAVILEELEELWIEIKKKKHQREPTFMRREAIQVAAMAIKFALFVEDKIM